MFCQTQGVKFGDDVILAAGQRGPRDGV